MKETYMVILCKGDIGHQPSPIAEFEASFQSQNIALGFFDYLYTIRFPENTATHNGNNMIWDASYKLSSNLDGSMSYHPIYLFYDDNQSDNLLVESKKRTDSFWNHPYTYFCMTMVHQKYIEYDPNKKIAGLSYKTIEDNISTIIEDGGFKRNEYLICRSLELSDCIVLWKIDSMSRLLQVAEEIQDSEDIGFVQTICSISLNNSNTKEDEIIELLSIRFSQRNSNILNEIIQVMSNDLRKDGGIVFPPYSCLGVEDVVLIAQKVKMNFLVSFMRTWINDPQKLRKYRDAASSVATQIGFPSPSKSKYDNHETALQRECKRLLVAFSEICKQDLTLLNSSASKAIKELLNQLVRMSNDCIMDGIACLMLHPIQEFIVLLGTTPYKKVLTTNPPKHKVQISGIDNSDILTNDAAIMRFVRGWQLVLEQAIKADGAFSHEPGYYPQFYNVPAKLLEFYATFIHTFSCALNLPDVDAKEGLRQYPIMLVPKACRKVKNNKVFPSLENTSNLLYVDVPIHNLYSLDLITSQLCHELSHFCGVRIRDRLSRRKIICNMAAVYLTTLLNIITKEEKHLDTYNKIGREIFDKLNLHTQDLHNRKETWISVGEKLKEILINEQSIIDKSAKLFSKMVSNKPNEQSFAKNKYYNEFQTARSQYKYQASIELFAYDMDYLFGECFADIVIILLLEISVQEYLQLFSDETDILENRPYARRLTIQRIAAVIRATYSNSNWSKGKGLNKIEKGFNKNNSLYADVRKYNRYFSSHLGKYGKKDKEYKEFHSIHLIETYLDGYLQNRVQYILSEVVNKGAHIAETYDKIVRTNRLASNDFFDLIENRRAELLMRLV